MNRKLIHFCLLLMYSQAILPAKAVVTYSFSGGRFGDNLISYMHAKWISFWYGIPLAYKPFPYSDQLKMHESEKMSFESVKHKKIIKLSRTCMDIDINKDVVYEVPYFSEFSCDRERSDNKNKMIYFQVNWQDQKFKDQLIAVIQPIAKLNMQPLTQDKISVALHIRRGGGFDLPLSYENKGSQSKNQQYIDRIFPLKFPPLSFYAKELKKLSEYYNNKPLYVFIFTDDRSPEKLAEYMKAQLPEYLNIEYDYHKEGNSHSNNVLEDFFAITLFDCLIRPLSNYSLIPGILKKFEYEVYPDIWNLK